MRIKSLSVYLSYLSISLTEESLFKHKRKIEFQITDQWFRVSNRYL